MSPKSRLQKRVVLVIAFGLALGAAGCSMDDVQFNGGVFDAVGLSDAARTKSSEPKLAERAPLVVPPTLDKLPQPGQQPPEPAQIAGINDPDAAKSASQEELQHRQAEYCEIHYEEPKRRGDDSADSAVGPLGPCRPSVLTAVKKWNSDE